MTTDSVPQIPSKVCTTCGIEKEATSEHWHKHKDCKYGVRSECKSCRKVWNEANRESRAAKSKGWREANRDKIKERSAVYRAENQDKIIAWREANPEYRAIYKRNNHEREKEKRAAWYQANKEKQNGRCKAWEVSNPSKRKAISQRRRARINQSTEHFTAQDLEIQYRSQRGKCWHCLCELNGNYEPDHLTPLAKGGTNAPDNIVCSCMPCNRSKYDKTVMEWKGRLV